MDKFKSLEPISEWHTNSALKGYDDIPDLPITRFDDGTMASVWKIKSIWWRLKFLLTGKLTMTIMGQTHPPVGLHIGELITKTEEQ